MSKKTTKKTTGKRGPKPWRNPTATVSIRCMVTPEQRDMIRVAAAKKGVPMSSFAENAVVSAAESVS